MIFGDFSVPHFRGFMRRAPQSLTLIATVCILGLSIRSAYAITVGSACISGYNGYLAFDNSSPGNLLVCNGTTWGLGLSFTIRRLRWHRQHIAGSAAGYR